MTPAQLTRIPTGPRSFSACPTSERTCSPSVTSVGTMMLLWPGLSSRPDWTSSSTSSRLAASATLAPSAQSARATAAPMPLDAPVTTATLPASRPPLIGRPADRSTDQRSSGRAPVIFGVLLGLPGPEVPEELQLLYHLLGALLGRLLVGLEHEVGGVGRFVGVGDAGELFDLPRESLLVEAFHVPVGADLQRGVDEDLDEVHDPAPYLIPRLFIGRDGAHDHPDPVAREQVGDEPYPQDVYVAVVPGEAQALGEVGPDDVPVEYLHEPLPAPELALDDLGDGGLART